MKIAILGGTFNPPHFGHLFFANEVRQKLGYDKIIFVPSNISAHKNNDNSITSDNRVKMLDLSIKNLNWAEVSMCDINRGGITRTIDTIKDIKKEFNLTEKPGFIIGDDLLKSFHNWKDPDKIVELADLIIGIRDQNKIELKYHCRSINNRIFPLSSSEIRERVSKGIDIDFLLPEDVIKYIKNNGLYRNN